LVKSEISELKKKLMVLEVRKAQLEESLSKNPPNKQPPK